MALRAVPEHPKFADLKKLLALPKGATLGWLESIWHFAGRFTPRGDIGKYTDAQIEAWVEWDGAAGGLVAALVASGWLDACDEYRILVHDWHVHADNATKLAVKRSGSQFCVSTKSEKSRQCVHSVEETPTSLGLPVPVPVPVPVPEPGAGRRATFQPSITDQASMVATRVACEAPVAGMKVRMAIEQTARFEITNGVDPDMVANVMLEAWRDFKTAAGKLEYVWGAEKFFGEGNWKDKTAWPWKEGQAPPLKRKYLEVA